MLNEIKSRFPGRKLIILFVMFLTGMLSAQNWTAVKETNINVANAQSNAQSVDIFTNGYGNHIIVQWNNSLLYYNMDVNGVAGTPITLESSSVVSPSITGDADNIYVVYRKSSETFIRTKYSTDGGNSWQYLSTYPQNSNANSVESIYSNGKLHITFSVSNTVYYSKYFNGWMIPQPVSIGESGSMPRITAWYTSTQDRVYFLYRKNSYESRWREYNVTTNSWVNNPQTAFTTGYNSHPAGFRVDVSSIYIYYSYRAPDPFGDYHNYFDWVVRNISNNSIIHSGTPNINDMAYVYATNTANGKSNTVFYYTWLAGQGSNAVGIWRSNSNDGYPSDLVYEYLDLFYFPNYLNLSSASNDVYVIWQDAIGGNNLRMKYDDQNPLTPQNFAVSVYQTQYDSYPKLNWDLNNEPDVRGNDDNGYLIERRLNGGSFDPIASVSGMTSEYIDYQIHYAGSGPNSAEYKIRANDVNQNTSEYTEIGRVRWGNIWKKNSGEETVSVEYGLKQNYPNPFNPSTEIKYTLAEDSYVTVKVYDMLGTEVAEIVDEPQAVGNYEINFNANNLSSGVYIYRITASKNGRIVYTNAKQMILLR